MAAKNSTSAKPVVFRDAKDTLIACLGLNESDVEIDEGTAEKPKREIVLTLLKEGPGNARDKRWYEKSCVEGIESLVYSRRKIFKNHLAEGAKPASDKIEDWCATITQTWLTEGADGGMVRKGRIKVHDDWLWERAKDPVARKELAVSIEGRGAGREDQKNGEKFTCIESITWLNAFKLVPYPGNATMGADTVEGASAPVVQITQEDSTMDPKLITLALLEADRPDLIEAITAKVSAKLAEKAKAGTDAVSALREELKAEFSGKVTSLTDTITKLTAQLSESDRKLDAAEVRGKLAIKETYIKAALEEAALPKEALTERFMARLRSVTEREVVDSKGGKTILGVEEQIKAEVAEQKALVMPALGGAIRKGVKTVTAAEGAREISEDEKQFMYDKKFLGIHEEFESYEEFAAAKKKTKVKVAKVDAEDDEDEDDDKGGNAK